MQFDGLELIYSKYSPKMNGFGNPLANLIDFL